MSGPSPRAGHPSRPLSRLIQGLGVLFLRPLVRFLYRARVRLAAPLPHPPCVLACNHRSYLDPPFVAVWMNHPVSYFARSNLWESPPIRFILEVMQGIPVDRANPGVSSMKGAVDRLRQGVSVLVFPEGTRTRDGRIGILRDGPALFARRAGVPVVPVYVHRTERAWPRGASLPRLGGCRLEIRFGRALVPPADLPPRAQDAWVMRCLQAWMVAQERSLYPHRAAAAPAVR